MSTFLVCLLFIECYRSYENLSHVEMGNYECSMVVVPAQWDASLL